MEGNRTGTAVVEAVSFLSSRIEEQSRVDLVPLSEIELRQLAFSEETPSQEMFADADEFDASHNRAKFEAKIVKLLRRAYHSDVKRGLAKTWQTHLAALRDHDIYVLVMVDMAKIPRPKPRISIASFCATLAPKRMIRLLIPALLALVSLVGGIYFLVLPMRWSRGSDGVRVFGDLAERLIPSESLRLAAFVVWIGGIGGFHVVDRFVNKPR